MNKALTPMMKQYMEIKENTNDALVFYRLGDFYELFFEDAEVAARVLDLVLTERSAGKGEKAKMCGVPHHASKNYIQKLVANGYKVAIVEQVEDPRDAVGIVKREVVEIITPGTYFDLDDNETREIATVQMDQLYSSVVMCDLVSGQIRGIRVNSDPIEIIKVLQQFQVRELIINEGTNPKLIQEIQDKTHIVLSIENQYSNKIQHSDSAFELALQRLYQYLYYTHRRHLTHLTEMVLLNDESYLKLDYNSLQNLELINDGKGKDLSLFQFLNKTKTNSGARLLKQWIMQPLVSEASIISRQDRIDLVMNDFILSEGLSNELKDSYDIHRVVARVVSGKHNAQDFVRLKSTLKNFEAIQELLQDQELFANLVNLDPLKELHDTLDEAIFDNAPVLLKEGRTFKSGIHEELDELRAISSGGRKWLLEYEAQQQAITGIKNLKISYNKAFGYFIEISKGQIENVKPEFGFIRKQTLTNAERYINQELQEYETKASQATERTLAIESELFSHYTSYVEGFTLSIGKIADALAELDGILSLMHISSLPGYVKPSFNHDRIVDLRQGKHPVLAATLQEHDYIASDVLINPDRNVLILTGPNMGGKSTYMRMIALNIILAQMGCFIPATSANLPLVDQIFTRMGASDDILMGQSTFMVEMMEAQMALTHASKNSLVLFDEIGRGTSTYDGMAIAQAIIEYIHISIGCMTVFSTHYHELVMLEDMYPGLVNVHVQVHEENDHVTFLYSVVDGSAKQSYGINVARLAHLPDSLIARASENLQRLELSKANIQLDSKVITLEVEPQHISIIKHRLKNLDVNQMTPIESLMLIAELKQVLEDHDE